VSAANTKAGIAGYPDPIAPDLFVNEARAAELLSVNPRTLQQWRLRGGGPPFVRISSRCVRYRWRDLLAWAEQRLRFSTSDFGS
jgi:hypothetical protein